MAAAEEHWERKEAQEASRPIQIFLGAGFQTRRPIAGRRLRKIAGSRSVPLADPIAAGWHLVMGKHEILPRQHLAGEVPVDDGERHVLNVG